MEKIRTAVKMAIKENDNLKRFALAYGKDFEDVLVEVLKDNYLLRLYIYQDFERECHKEDVNDACESRSIFVDDDTLDAITNKYEKYLSNSDDWNTFIDLAISDIIDIDDLDEDEDF